MAINTQTYRGQRIIRYFDSSTKKTVGGIAPVHFFDHFLGKTGAFSATGAAIWGLLDTSAAGDTTPVVKDDATGGAFTIKLDATDEAQLSGIYFGDCQPFDVTACPIFETTVTITSASMTGIKLVMGLASAHNATFDNIATNLWFRLDGSLALLVEGDDGTTDTDDQSAGVTWTTATSKTLRIEADSLSAVRFFVDGVSVGTVAVAAATGNLQPYFAITKASGTTLATVDIDSVRVMTL